MILSSGAKFRAYPTEKQKEVLSQWIGCQRFIYNAKVSEAKYFRTFRDHSLALTGTYLPIDQQYSQFKDKELTPFLYDVPSQILRNGATRFMGAQQRFWKGLAERPAFKRKSGRQTVWLTNELFRFVPTGTTGTCRQSKNINEYKLVVGTRKHNLGELRFKAHTEYGLPSTITLAREADKWFLSFSYEKQGVCISEEDLIAYYAAMPEDKLNEVTVGMDRGVMVPAKKSDGTSYNFAPEQKINLRAKELCRKANRLKGSGRWKLSVKKVARYHAYAANVRSDFAHKTSRKIVDSEAEVFVFENLNVKNMTRAPKPKLAEKTSNYLPNGAIAKAGLNKAILESAWGKVKTFTTYKARRASKLVIAIAPHGTSQECSKCSHTHPDNRLSQAEFVCQRCGFTENADFNASCTVKNSGIRMLLAGGISVKQEKRTMRLKNKQQPGPEQPEVTRGEMEISRSVGTYFQTASVGNRETPLEALLRFSGGRVPSVSI
jgi:putative transposase